MALDKCICIKDGYMLDGDKAQICVCGESYDYVYIEGLKFCHCVDTLIERNHSMSEDFFKIYFSKGVYMEYMSEGDFKI